MIWIWLYGSVKLNTSLFLILLYLSLPYNYMQCQIAYGMLQIIFKLHITKKGLEGTWSVQA